MMLHMSSSRPSDAALSRSARCFVLRVLVMGTFVPCAVSQDLPMQGSAGADARVGVEAVLDTVETVHPLLEAAALFVFPKTLQDGVLLKEFVRSEEFRKARERFGDVASVDILFRRALRMSWNNPYVALAILVPAVMDHDRVGVRLPLFGRLLWFPLTSEFPEEFAARCEALPRDLFPDAPGSGDRDKLQHFFGSALAGVLTESADAAERIGTFVEWGEDLFIVGGTVETRDMAANRRGIAFGFALLHDRTTLPSQFMRTPLHNVLSDSTQSRQENHP